MLGNYLKMAVKVLLRRKFFTFISLFGIAFTLIVLMVVVALFDHVFAPFPPEVNQDRTLLCIGLNGRGPTAQNGGPGYRLLDQYMRNLLHVETESFCTGTGSASTYKNGEKIEFYAKRTDGEFWRIFRFHFIEGAPYSDEDAKSGKSVAVINETMRRKLFGDRPGVGQTIEIEGRQFRISGVVANVSILRQIPFADIWIPIAATSDESYKKGLIGGFVGVFMLRSKADAAALRAEFQSVLRNAVSSQKEFTTIEGELMTKFDYFSTQLFPGFYGWEAKSHSNTLMALIILGMILFMTLPAVNLMNINVSRILERASEIGVRKAFGASSNTLVGQFVVENVLLSLIGGALGLLGAYMVLSAIERSGFISYAEFSLNYRVFGYGFVLAASFGLLSGIYPAWRMSRLHPVLALKGGAR